MLKNFITENRKEKKGRKKIERRKPNEEWYTYNIF